MSKKENKRHPDKVQRRKGKDLVGENDEKDRDLESGDNPAERRRMTGDNS